MSNKRLYRIDNGKMIFGVCGGIAEYFNVDPSLVRIGWVFFGLFAGTGLLAYIIAALILPLKINVK